MLPLQPIRLANAAAVAAAATWTVCAALVMLAPGLAMWVTGQMMHADLAAMHWNLTIGGFFVGMASWAILAWVLTAGIGSLYGLFGGPSGAKA